MRYLLLTLLLLGTSATYAHDTTTTFNDAERHHYRHHIALAIGNGSTDQHLNGNKGAGVPSRSYGDNQYKGTYSLTYRYFLRKGLAIGAGAAYEQSGGPWYDVSWPGRSPSSTYIGTYTRQVYTLAPELYYLYSRRPGAVAYGYVAFGVTYMHELATYDDEYFNKGKSWLHEKVQDNSRLHANFHITLIGLKIGERIGLFGELGYGYKGVIQAGIFGKFNQLRKKPN